MPALDLEDALELLLDALVEAATRAQAGLRGELADFVSVDGRLTLDDFRAFFPKLPGAAALTDLQLATIFEKSQDRGGDDGSARVRVDPAKFAMRAWAAGVLPDPAKERNARRPAAVDAPKKGLSWMGDGSHRHLFG